MSAPHRPWVPPTSTVLHYLKTAGTTTHNGEKAPDTATCGARGNLYAGKYGLETANVVAARLDLRLCKRCYPAGS